MKKIIRFFVVILIVVLSLSGCTQKNTAHLTADSASQEQSKSGKEILALKNKYAATDFYTDDIKFSAEITDVYKGKNLYAPITCIDDIFYIGEELFMYVDESLSNEHFLLKISPEQYSVIKTLHNDFLNFGLHIVFRLDNIEPMIPNMNADFYFDIQITDDVLADEESSLSFSARIIKGELVDIIES